MAPLSSVYLVRWDRTQKTWHTDVSGVGRYSVRSMVRGFWRAYLNNVGIDGIDANKDVELVKRAVEERIVAAKLIAGTESELPLKEGVSDGLRAEIIEAAMRGVSEYIRSTRGCAKLGARGRVLDNGHKGFILVYGDDNRVYFDVTEI